MARHRFQIPHEPVPDIYRGAWRRDYIRRANGVFDNLTQCWWLQAERYHIDLRVPSDRPQVANAQSLEQLDAAAREAFDRQTAWVGLTEVTGDRCQWWPDAALPGLSDEPDIGLMRFENDDELIETCPDGRYVERWVRSGTIRDRCVAVRLKAEGTSVDATLTIIVTGNLGGAALDVAGKPLEVSIAQATEQGLWRVLRASLPWTEGDPADSNTVPHPCEQWLQHLARRQESGTVNLMAGEITHWRILD